MSQSQPLGVGEAVSREIFLPSIVLELHHEVVDHCRHLRCGKIKELPGKKKSKTFPHSKEGFRSKTQRLQHLGAEVRCFINRARHEYENPLEA